MRRHTSCKIEHSHEQIRTLGHSLCWVLLCIFKCLSQNLELTKKPTQINLPSSMKPRFLIYLYLPSLWCHAWSTQSSPSYCLLPGLTEFIPFAGGFKLFVAVTDTVFIVFAGVVAILLLVALALLGHLLGFHIYLSKCEMHSCHKHFWKHAVAPDGWVLLG